jgi:hypothetical protein
MKLFTGAVAVAIASTVAVATPAYASCTVNHYDVVATSASVYEDPGIGYIKTKYFGQRVTGPNSNVESINSGSYRKVYTAEAWDGRGWMLTSTLSYQYCT